MMQNRGASELVGFVLIILIIIMLSVVIFFAFDVKKYFFDNEGNPCNNVKITVVSACYNEKNIIIKLENNGEFDINNGFLIRVYGSDVYDVPSAPFMLLSGFGVKEIVLPYESFVGKLAKIVILPKVVVNGKQYICDSSLGGYKVDAC